MTDERAIIKLGLKTGPGSSHGKSVQDANSVRYYSLRLGLIRSTREPEWTNG